MAAYLTIKEVAEHLGTSAAFVQSQLRQGKLRGYKMGKLWRITPEDLAEYEEKARYQVPKPKFVHKRIVTRIG